MPILRLEVHLPPDTEVTAGTCAACGCVDERACDGGCFWVDSSHLLCSACFEAALEGVDPRRATKTVGTTHEDGSETLSLTIHMKPPKPARRRRC